MKTAETVVLDYAPGAGIKQALAHARVVPVTDDLAERESCLKKIQGIRSRLLPVEAEASAELAKQERVALEEVGLAKTMNNISHLGEAKLLDPAAFAVRNKDGLPLLAPFSLGSAEATIQSEGNDVLPVCCLNYYRDVKEKLAARNGFLGSLIFPIFAVALAYLFFWLSDLTVSSVLDQTFPASILFGTVLFITAIVAEATEGRLKQGIIFGACFLLLMVLWPIAGLLILGAFSQISFRRLWVASAKFSGMIPASARAKINEAKLCGGFKEIFLLAEVPRWEVRNEPMPMPTLKGDPLTVGFDGERFWLIDAWETTTAEQYVADEFVTKPNDPAV
ncbi:MAG: hypothetical protein WC250_04000 [Candidatus Paceibacterota bacterium]|jgi:hypothetical protein